MARTGLGSSRRGRRAARSGERIVQYTPTEADRQAALARGPRRPVPDSAIDFSDIPETSDEDLAAMVRARAERLAHLATPRRRKVTITMRIDPYLLASVQALARAQGVKYQALMQQLLAGAVVREVGATR